MDKYRIGRIGEKIACDYLRKKGYVIKKRNWAKPRWGEIDIIAEYKDTIRFIEVRTQTSENYKYPIESISNKKIKSLKRSIDYYILTEVPETSHKAFNIEFVTVLLNSTTNKAIKIMHYTGWPDS